MEDVGITQNQLNAGQQLMSLGIVLFEFPSNMALYRVGPARWLTLQLFLLVSLLLSLKRVSPTDHVISMLFFPIESQTTHRRIHHKRSDELPTNPHPAAPSPAFKPSKPTTPPS